MSGPLAGLRVLDLTSVVMGPYATQVLGDLGADILKVEPPEGDVMRQAGPMRNPKMGHLYLTTNRNKRSVVLNLKTDPDRRAFLKLAETSDILVYNIRPKAMARLGLSYEDVKAINPSIIYVGAIGFSQNGPYADRPAYDDLIQGMAGIPWLSMQSGATFPRYAPFVMADRMVGLQVAVAILAAVNYRNKTGKGQSVEVPMFESLVSVILGEHLAGKLFEPAIGPIGYQRSIAKNRRPYRTSDGYICTMVYSDKHWKNFLTGIGKPELFEAGSMFSSQGARLENIDAVYGYLSDLLETKSTSEWMEFFVSADIPASPMNSMDDILNDEHLNSIGFFETITHPSEGKMINIAVPSRWSESQPTEFRHAPQIGEHTHEVLAEDEPAESNT